MMRTPFLTSMASRLGWSFTMLLGLALIGAGAMHSQATARLLAQRNDSELVTKVKLIRYLVQDAPNTDAIRSASQRFIEAASYDPDLDKSDSDDPDVVVVLRSDRGNILAANVPARQAEAAPVAPSGTDAPETSTSDAAPLAKKRG